MEYDPKRVTTELEQFQQDAALFSERQPEFHEQFPGHAVAVYRGEVVHDETLEGLMTQLTERNIPSNKAYVGWAISGEQQADAENRASSLARSISPNR